MLISGRKDMEKSLKSLLPFKKAFPCEIILVDTGCNEQQRTIAEKYADKIIDFTWCGDFAMARNAGLGEAHGEWFMYLDDDEWFDNPQEIIAFFNPETARNITVPPMWSEIIWILKEKHGYILIHPEWLK